MKIAIDTETRAVLTWRGEALLSLPMTRGDRFPVELRFISGGKFSSLPEGASGKLMLKRAGAYAADPLAASLGWVRSGAAANTIYTFSLNLNTVQLNSALTGNTLELALEVEWSHGDTIQSSLPVSVVVARDYIQGSEGIPEEAIDLRATEADAIAGTNNEKWVSPLRAWDAIRAWANANFNWANLADKPSAFAPSSHKSSHATGGTDPLTPAHIGAATSAQGAKADSALQPGTAISNISGLQAAIDGKQPAGSYAPASGIAPTAISGTAVVDADPRLTDARPPAAHKSSHAANGTDALAPADIGAVEAFQIQGNPPETNIAPAAMELRDNEDLGVALKLDSSTQEKWFIEKPEALRAAIGTVRRVPNGELPDSSQGYVDQATQLWDPANDAIALSIHDGAVDFGPYAENTNVAANFRNAIGAAPASDSNPDVANSALELRDDEDTGGVALKCDGRTNDRWSVLFPDSFRAAIGAATAAQGALADTALQPGDAISAASIAVGSASGGLVADLYVGLDGKVGIGTETPSEKLTVSGHIDILGGQVKNLGAPVDATDAATKGFVDTAIADLTPEDIGAATVADTAGLQAALAGKVSNYVHPTTGEQTDVAPAAMELRSIENGTTLGLRYDSVFETSEEGQGGGGDSPWTIASPTSFRNAISAQTAGSYAPASGIEPTAISGTAVVDADPRLTDARPPTAHKSSHAWGGTDALTPEDIGAAPSFGGNPDVAISAMELRDNEDTGAVALKCDGTLTPQDNPWSVLFPDKFCTAIGAVKSYGNPPDENIAPAAMELRDKNDFSVALGVDNAADGWFVRFPDSFRTAIGAAPASGSNPDVANSALGLYDSPNGWDALKIDDSRVFLAGEEFDLRGAPDGPTALKQNFRAAIGLGNVQNTADQDKPLSNGAQLALSAKSPLSVFIRLSGCPDTNFNTLYTYAGIFEGEPKYYAATGESLSFNSEEWVVETAEQVTKYFNTRSDLDPSTLTSGWKRVVGGSSLPVSIIVERVGPVPNKNTLADPVVQAATELRTEESNDVTALIYSAEDDSWHVHDADNFRVAIGAATGAQGAKADTSLQQGAYISAASLEVGSIAAGQTADLYVGLDGKVGVGTETPSEKLTVSGHIDLLGGQVKNLGTPVSDTDAATKNYVDNLIPQAPTTGTYTLRSVDGVVSWVAA